jgi:hypothetical protein
MVFEKVYKFLIEENKPFDAFRYLDELGVLGKRYTYWDVVKSFYLKNTNLSKEEINEMLYNKQKAAEKENSPYFMRLLDTAALLATKEDSIKHYDELKDTHPNMYNALAVHASYGIDNNVIFINPYADFLDEENFMDTLYHEFIHSIQDHSQEEVYDLSKHDQEHTRPILYKDVPAGDSIDYDQEYLEYLTSPVEIDTLLAVVNRVVGQVFNDFILPGDKEKARKYFYWFIDEKNQQKIPAIYRNAAIQLRRYTENLNNPNAIEELINRVSLLAKNTKPTTGSIS